MCTPWESPLIWTVSPAATVAGGGRQAVAGTNGTVPAGPPTPLRGGTNPPPNAVTSVNVWLSPPAFVTRTVCPAGIEIYPGENCHAGCPMTFAASGENSSPMNSEKVVSCGCAVAAHVPGPMAALKVSRHRREAPGGYRHFGKLFFPTHRDRRVHGDLEPQPAVLPTSDVWRK